MSNANDAKFSLKVVVNKQRTKVLFAEIDSDFADVLLSFLTLPLGTIVRVLKKHYGDGERINIGSLTSLYNGLANLSSDHFGTEYGKMMLLNPRSCFEAEYRRLKLDISDTHPTRYYSCEDWNCMYRRWTHVIMSCDTISCPCGKTMKREVGIENSQVRAFGSCGVFMINKISFLISDDLRMVPNLAVPTMQTLRNLGIRDIDDAELRDVTFGFNEVMDLLKGSLLSITPLTDIILSKGQMECADEKSETGIFSHEKEKKPTSSESDKKIKLRLMVQSSTNKLLFAQCEEDFIDFLFSFLTIPLGRVECLLDGKTCLRNVDNLYRSVENINGDKYLRTPDTKGRITNPKLPHGYMTENKIIHLIEQNILYHNEDSCLKKEWLSYYKNDRILFCKPIWCSEDLGDYVKGPTMYMVTDDLTVTPSCMISSLSLLHEKKISSSDVKEVEVQIGLEEALRILKASLTSTSALTDGLMVKQPKQERL